MQLSVISRKIFSVDEGIGFTLLYFEMAVMPLFPENKDGGRQSTNQSREPIGQESHVAIAHNYARNSDLVPRIWSRLHDKVCLYIISSS